MCHLKHPVSGETWVDNLDRAISLVGEKKNFLFCGYIDPDSVGLGFLNLMSAAYKKIENICKPSDPDWFTAILRFLLNHVPEETRKVGMVCYNGKNAAGEDCIFIKLRRSAEYDSFDLREVEDPIKKAFDGCYVGGGHSGAASYRVASHDEKEFFLRFQPVADFIKSSIK